MKKDKLLFMHVPKCGGHSANSAFYKMFGLNNVLKVWDPQDYGDVLASEFPNMPVDEITSYRCVTGHLFFPDVVEKFGADLLNSQYFVCALVRDPVRQVLSLWNYVNENKNHPDHEKVKDMEFARFVEEFTVNQQSAFLSGCTDGKAALDLVLNHYDLVRPLAEFDSFVSEVADYFEALCPPSVNFNKTNTPRLRPEEIDDRTLSIIKQVNSEDCLLFEGVKQRWSANKAA